MSSKNSIDSAPSIDKNEKSGIEKESANKNNEQNGSLNHEKPWYDKQIVSWIPAFSYSTSQIVLLSFVCFMSTGLYNSLSGLGGAGIDDIGVANNANVALYCTFATVGFFAGTICNTLGIKFCLAFGASGYTLYSGSLLCWNKTSNAGFVIFSGALLGVCAACLWAAQGTIIMSYPPEHRKGRAIMIFWIIFNMGAVIGLIISLANNIHSVQTLVSDTTFAIFIALMGLGIVLALFLLPIHLVWKDRVGGQRVYVKEYPNWKKELVQLFRTLYREPRVFLVFPMCFASNWFYTYQFNDVNAGRFNIRTRSLNSLLYWIMQLVGAILFGGLLDWKRFDRKTRAKLGWAALFILTMAIWGAGLKFQLLFTRESVKEMKAIDFTDSNYVGPVILYVFYGIYDAVWQTYIYYLLGALSNSPKKAALYGSMYKGIQSAGAAIAWRLDYYEIPYLNMFGSCWGLLGGSLLIAAPLVFYQIENHTSEEDDDINLTLTVAKSESSHLERAA